MKKMSVYTIATIIALAIVAAPIVPTFSNGFTKNEAFAGGKKKDDDEKGKDKQPGKGKNKPAAGGQGGQSGGGGTPTPPRKKCKITNPKCFIHNSPLGKGTKKGHFLAYCLCPVQEATLIPAGAGSGQSQA